MAPEVLRKGRSKAEADMMGAAAKQQGRPQRAAQHGGQGTAQPGPQQGQGQGQEQEQEQGHLHLQAAASQPPCQTSPPAPPPLQAPHPTQVEPGGVPCQPQLSNPEGPSFAADVWAVGCVLYEMLLGKAPFTLKPLRSVQELVLRIRAGTSELEMPEGVVGPDAKHFIQACLAKHPGDRPTTLELLAHPLIHKYCKPSNLPSNCIYSLGSGFSSGCVFHGQRDAECSAMMC